MRTSVALIAVMLVAAGCGGGNGGKTAGKPPGSVIRDFRARVSGAKATLTATLSGPTTLSLKVVRLSRPNPSEAGKVGFGRRTGRVTLDWDLRVRGRRLQPGRYRLRLVGAKGAGRSRAAVITVPR